MHNELGYVDFGELNDYFTLVPASQATPGIHDVLLSMDSVAHYLSQVNESAFTFHDTSHDTRFGEYTERVACTSAILQRYVYIVLPDMCKYLALELGRYWLLAHAPWTRGYWAPAGSLILRTQAPPTPDEMPALRELSPEQYRIGVAMLPVEVRGWVSVVNKDGVPISAANGAQRAMLMRCSGHVITDGRPDVASLFYFSTVVKSKTQRGAYVSPVTSRFEFNKERLT